jgi:hypothetical protein
MEKIILSRVIKCLFSLHPSIWEIMENGMHLIVVITTYLSMNYRNTKGEAHIGKEWDSDCSSFDYDDEGLAALAFDKSFLFPNEHHTCLMAKEKKVRTRDTPKYTSYSDEEYDDDVDYSDIFKGLDRSKVDKINEVIDALNEKDRLLEKQHDILYEEHDKCINAEKSRAVEIKKNELLSSELSSCRDSISRLKNLNAKLEKSKCC